MSETIKDTYRKCFLLDTSSNSVYGLVSENDITVSFQWLGNAGDGKFYVMSTHTDRKEVFKDRLFEITFDYNEAYYHLTSKKWNQ